MNCPQCTNEMIQAQATNFGEEYFYCRTCKKELAEMQLESQMEKAAQLIAEEYAIPGFGKITLPHANPKFSIGQGVDFRGIHHVILDIPQSATDYTYEIYNTISGVSLIVREQDLSQWTPTKTATP